MTLTQALVYLSEGKAQFGQTRRFASKSDYLLDQAMRQG